MIIIIDDQKNQLLKSKKKLQTLPENDPEKQKRSINKSLINAIETEKENRKIY